MAVSFGTWRAAADRARRVRARWDWPKAIWWGVGLLISLLLWTGVAVALVVLL